MFIYNRLTQHVSGIIMPNVRGTDCIKPRVVSAWMCWLRLCGVGTRAECLVWMQVFDSNTFINTRRGFIQYVLLTMGIMMPETCWVNLLWINTYTCVICWFLLLIRGSVGSGRHPMARRFGDMRILQSYKGGGEVKEVGRRPWKLRTSSFTSEWVVFAKRGHSKYKLRFMQLCVGGQRKCMVIFCMCNNKVVPRYK